MTEAPRRAADARTRDADSPGMTGYRLELDLNVVAPSSAEWLAVLTAFFRDVVSRHHGREATDAEVAAAMRAEPSDDLRMPSGVLLLARHRSEAVGCVGLRLLPAGLGEVTRVFVLPAVRRRGVAQQLMEALEKVARVYGVTRLRLDTSDYLTEARALYVKNGYQEVAPFSDGGLANLWFEKPLARAWHADDSSS